MSIVDLVAILILGLWQAPSEATTGMTLSGHEGLLQEVPEAEQEAEIDQGMVDLTLQFILGLHPDWREDYCPTVNMREDLCRAKQEEGYATAQLLAPIFVQESERSGLGPTGPFWLASIAMKENSLMTGDQCVINVTKSKLYSMEELSPSAAGERRARLCVQMHNSNRISCRSALVLEEADETIRINYCMAGEVGLFQLTPHEARAGTIVPATGEELPVNYRERRDRLMDPLINTSIAASALADFMADCCEDEHLERCRSHWDLWVGAYNTGSCRSTRSMEYARRVRAYYERGMEYLCRQSPDSAFCTDHEPGGPVEDPPTPVQ